MTLGHALYISRAARPMGEEELRTLAATAGDANAQKDVTGILLYSQGAFLQILEGERGIIRPLFDRIAVDPRHIGVELLVLEDVRHRLFPSWNMRLLNLDSRAAPELDRLASMVRAARAGQKNVYSPGFAMAVLRSFEQKFRAAA